MPRLGIATLVLHSGKAPGWLLKRMKALARTIVVALAEEFGPQELLRRLADPFWFQSLGCVLAFDWHSSGLTTTLTGVLKQALREADVGVYAAGGKGARALGTPGELLEAAERKGFDPSGLLYASRMCAKVDNAAVQDGFSLYHHVMFFTPQGQWAVLQQGMNPALKMARRYHWLSAALKGGFVHEPHTGVCSDVRTRTLNMVASESAPSRAAVAELARERPEGLLRHLRMPRRHQVLPQLDIEPRRFLRTMQVVYERQPGDFEALLQVRGVGPRTVRALSLIAELLYGSPPSWRDPARYSYALGGKDGTPFPVDRAAYEQTIQVMERAIGGARGLSRTERLQALRRLHNISGGVFR